MATYKETKYINLGRGGACSSRLPQNNIFEYLIAFSRATNGRPYGFVRCRFVCGIYFFTGGASPSPTDLYVTVSPVQTRQINQNLKSNLAIAVCRNKFYPHKHRCSPVGASRPKFEIKSRHRGVQKQISYAQTSTFASGGVPARPKFENKQYHRRVR